MADLGQLIDRLSRQDDPVRRLPSPIMRLLRWAVLSIALMALSTSWHGMRGDLSSVVANPAWLVEQALAMITALLAGFAAISFSVPGRPEWDKLAWVPVGGFWLLVLWESAQSTAHAEAMPDLMHLFCPYCFPVISIGSALLLAVDMRRAAPMAPVRMMALLLIAGCSMALFGERLIHDELDAPLLVVIQVLAILLIGALLAPFGRVMFRWKGH